MGKADNAASAAQISAKLLSPPKSPLRFLLWVSRENLLWASGAILAVCIANTLTRVGIYLVKILTDTATDILQGNAPVSDLWFWVLFYPAFYVALECVWRCSGFCGMQWITRTTAVVYRRLFDYLTGHSAAYFSDRYAGALTNKISNAAKGIEALMMQGLWGFLTLFVGLIGNIVITYLAHPYFAMVLIVWFTVFFGMNIVCARGIHKYAYRHAEASSMLRGKLVDSASNIETVQSSGWMEHERDYIEHYIGSEQRAHLKRWWIGEWVLVANSVLLGVLMAAMLSTVAYLIAKDAVTVGTLAMIITVLISLERSLFFLGNALIEAMGNYGQVDEGLRELLEPHSIVEGGAAPELIVSLGGVSIDAISFNYESGVLFKELSLVIPPGQKVGLVGPSGAGKSSLVNLLLRQYDVLSGQIEIDRQDIREVTLESLRRAIGLVPQNTSLFHRSIMDNIRYGRLDASDEEVREAARLAEAHEFIESLPNGYETFVGERGVKLSGGQRQRISIARAILKAAPILILDEATSALDSESEKAIQAALKELMRGRTVIAIAHRLSTLRAMDRIVVLDKGKIVEDGPHQELLDRAGLYWSMWNSQVEGFVGG